MFRPHVCAQEELTGLNYIFMFGILKGGARNNQSLSRLFLIRRVALLSKSSVFVVIPAPTFLNHGTCPPCFNNAHIKRLILRLKLVEVKVTKTKHLQPIKLKRASPLSKLNWIKKKKSKWKLTIKYNIMTDPQNYNSKWSGDLITCLHWTRGSPFPPYDTASDSVAEQRVSHSHQQHSLMFALWSSLPL